MTKEEVRRLLWMAALIVPIPAGAYAVHTADSITVAGASFFLLALIVPCLWLSLSGGENSVRAAAHAVCAPTCVIPFLLSVSAFLMHEKMTAESRLLFHGAAALFSMLAVLAMIFLLDEICRKLYRRLQKKSRAVVEWLVFAFFYGTIPAVILFSLAVVGFSGFAYAYASFLILVSVMIHVLYLKIFLAMAAVALYLFLGTRGNKWVRLTRAAFTGFFWLILVWIPMLVSDSMETYAAWRLYADPSYLVIFPILSDLWLSAASLWAGRKVTNWIFIQDSI